MNTMTDETRQQVTDAALMELLSESENWDCTAGPDGVKMDTFLAQCMGNQISVDDYYLPDGSFDMQRAYAAYSASGSPNASVKILCSAYLHDENFQNVTIMDVDETNGAVITHNASSNTYTVSFCGTRNGYGEWTDNADGLLHDASQAQRNAATYFDMWSRRFDPDANVVVTGHSKGGNKAQYVTMFSDNRGMIDQCVALDGQGFSDEAMAEMQSHEDFETQRSKISLVCGEDDYVHVLGNRLALPEQTYYLQCNNRVSYEGGDAFMQDHQVAKLFVNANGQFTYELNGPASQGVQSRFVEVLYARLATTLDKETFNFCARTMMNIMEGTADTGDIIKMAGFVTAPVSEVLYYTPEGRALLDTLPVELLSNEQMQGAGGALAIIFVRVFPQALGNILRYKEVFTSVSGFTYALSAVQKFLYTNFRVGGSRSPTTGAHLAGMYESMTVDTGVMRQCAARFRSIARQLDDAKYSLEQSYSATHSDNKTDKLVAERPKRYVAENDTHYRSAQSSMDSAIKDLNTLASALDSMASVLESAEETALKYASLAP